MAFLSGRTSLTTVQAGDIATDAITTAKIAASAVTTAKIAANNIDSTLTKDALIADYTEVTAATGDSLLLGDVNDSGNTKRDTVQGILDLVPAAGGFTLATPQATTSGSNVTFGSIPTGTTMIVVMFNGVSCSSTDDDLDVTIGDAGGLEKSGYISCSKHITGTTLASTPSTLEFKIRNDSADSTAGGHMILSLENSSTFTWAASGIVTHNPAGGELMAYGAGVKSLSAELTQVDIANGGGGTFDAGEINIMYQ
jgi:hypothetical protein